MRARILRPGFFDNEELGKLPALCRILFQGLWCLADREGRLEDRGERIKVRVLPYDNCDIEKFLNLLNEHGFIYRYSLNGYGSLIQILNFTKHQSPHHTEKESEIPPPVPPLSTSTNTRRDTDTNKGSTARVLREATDNSRNNNGENTVKIPIMTIPLIKKDGRFEIYQEDIDEWQDTFPNVNVISLLKYIRQWNKDNPSKRKTSGGIRKHISSWMRREQDKYRGPTREKKEETGWNDVEPTRADEDFRRRYKGEP